MEIIENRIQSQISTVKGKVPSGSGAKKKTNIDREYWDDIQFLTPHMHK